MLEIVQDQQQVTRADRVPHKIGDWCGSPLGHAQRLRNRGEHKCGISQLGKPNERHAVREARLGLVRDGQGQPGLADTAGAGECDEGNSGIGEEPADISQFSRGRPAACGETVSARVEDVAEP